MIAFDNIPSFASQPKGNLYTISLKSNLAHSYCSEDFCGFAAIWLGRYIY